MSWIASDRGASGRVFERGLRAAGRGALSLAATCAVLCLGASVHASVTLVDPAGGVDDHAGEAVAVSASFAVIGVPGSDLSQVNSGKVVVFDAVTNAYLRTLANPTPALGDNFGAAVAANSSLVVVGAPADDTSAVDSGAVYVFDGGTGALLRTILNPAPAVFDAFGSSLALAGSLLVVGAPEDDQGAASAGSAYLFDVTTGGLLFTLANPTPVGSDNFGAAVATDGSLVVVGAPQDDTGASNSGQAYVFDATTGLLVRSLANPTPLTGDLFGSAVGIAGGVIVVGAPDDDGAANNAGAAYTFNATTGALIATLQDPIPGGAEFFGSAVAVHGSSILVGEPNDDLSADRAGAAHVFNRVTGAFLRTLPNPTPLATEFAGTSVALWSGRALVGVPQDNAAAASSGSAYIESIAVCGDGTVELDEQCEDGNTANGDCCSSLCQLDGVGATCTDDGNTCSADVCDGAGHCTHPPGNAGTTCRVAAGACDVAETCTGASTSCPNDGFAAPGTSCPDDSNPCSQDVCDGFGSCSHPAGNPGAICRLQATECDVVETCTGASTACPADAFQPSTTACSDDANPCTVDRCDGAGACVHPAGNGGTVCRASAGVCDVTEFCTGASSACPANAFVPAGTVCRASADVCDVAEACSGASAACPGDDHLLDTDGDGACDLIDNCDAAPNAGQGDLDGDGAGDACDPCTSLAPPVVERASLALSRLLLPGGDDRLTLSGTANFPTFPAIDPVLKGLRLVVTDATGVVVVDATLPGGAYSSAVKRGWTASATGDRYSFRDSSGASVAGITSISMRASGNVAGRFSLRIRGKGGSYTAIGAALPLSLTVVLDAPVATTGQCAVSAYDASSCRVASGGATIRCR